MFIVDDLSQLAVLPIDSSNTTFAEVGTGPGGNSYIETDSSNDAPVVKRFYWED